MSALTTSPAAIRLIKDSCNLLIGNGAGSLMSGWVTLVTPVTLNFLPFGWMKQLPYLSRHKLSFTRLFSSSIGSKVRAQKDAGRLRGQNLSERYVRLAKSMRAKDAFVGGQNVPSTSIDSFHGQPSLKRNFNNTFHGFFIPEPPQEPSSEGVF